MTIHTTYNEISRSAWSELVVKSPTGNWFQTPEAYEFFSSLPELFRPFVVAVSADGTLRGVCVGYITKEKNPVKQWLTRRAIIVGGPALENDCTNEEVAALMHQVKAKIKELGGAIYIETRNFNDYSRWREGFEKAGFVYEEHLNFHLDCSDETIILKSMNESRRRQVKKGLKSGVVIEEALSEQDVHDYYLILQHLYKTKVKTPLFDEEFFLKFYREQYGKYLLVKYHGNVIGGIMCPILQDRTIYEWFVCGQDEQYKEQYPSVLATYAAICYGARHGIARFDFMGAGKPNDGYGVRVFKERFGGKLVAYGRYRCISMSILYKIGEMGVNILKRQK